MSDRADVAAWADSGAMALTGRPDGPPLGPPAPLVGSLRRIAASLPIDVDPLALLVERAAIAGLSRQGTTSCGGATRLLRAADGWLAVCLARDADIELLPAWLECGVPADHGDVWSRLAGVVAVRAVGGLEERARLLGLPVGVLPAKPCPDLTTCVDFGPIATVKPLADVLVVDLTAMWAGPLCGRLLAEAGARVVKIESAGRPDEARRGPPEFFELLNGGKESSVFDFDGADDRDALRQLVGGADVVLEASRPRALRSLGIDAAWVMAAGGPSVWVSITGYGRNNDGVAFGDDAAVAGGLVCWDADGPVFCADAIADPVNGLAAAAAVFGVLSAGRRQLVDLSMTGLSSRMAGPTLAVP